MHQYINVWKQNKQQQEKVSFNIPPNIYIPRYKSNQNENFAEVREREIMEF